MPVLTYPEPVGPAIDPASLTQPELNMIAMLRASPYFTEVLYQQMCLVDKLGAYQLSEVEKRGLLFYYRPQDEISSDSSRSVA